MYWDTDTNLLWLRHEKERHGCDERLHATRTNYLAIASALIRKMRFLAVSEEVWNLRLEEQDFKLSVPGVEVVFVV